MTTAVQPGELVAMDMSFESATSVSVASSLDSLCSSDVGGDTETVTSVDDNSVSHQKPIAHTQDLKLAKLCINSIRFLCIDAINNANSGHPGICMGMAPVMFVLFDNHLRFNPENPNWVNRDRFILSAGHGSMLLYAALHLYGYASVTMSDIKNFRKLHSHTPGHPECTETAGVEVCTGPLGQGISNAVGVAIAEAHVASVYNRPGLNIIDNYTYCITGDGCLMEGISSEACSLAGHLKLGKLIVIYDDNHISIDGSTDLAFTEDVSSRFGAYGWQVLHVENGNEDIYGIDAAIVKAKGCKDRPTLIKVTTTIGFGSPGKAGSAKVHGSALGKEETEATRESLSFAHEAFHVPARASEHMRRKINEGESLEGKWRNSLESYGAEYPELRRLFESETVRGETSDAVEAELRKSAELYRAESQATRKHSKVMLNAIAPVFPHLLGGAADTTPSTLTNLDCSKDFTASWRSGRNIRFGVREHAMGAICNGLSLAGYNLRSFCSTFLVFSDYMRAAMRMASLSQTGTMFVMTHDSIGLGEDGPSHQPIEHLASLRAMPNHDVWRPADGVETAAAYASAISSRSTPSTLVFSRQTTAALADSNMDDALRGGYVVGGDAVEVDGTLVATGSEVAVALDAASELEREGFRVRVVSMPCWEAFERQDKRYRRAVMGIGRERCVAVEAGSSFGWSRYADHFVCIDEFGKSGAGADVMQHFGFSASCIKKTFLRMLREDQ